MAKRMTDSEKWDKRWFRTLAPKMKLMWLYICDSCDAAGIWSEDLELASFKIGLEIPRDEYEKAFAGRMTRLDDDKVFFPGFIEFQYGTLSPTCQPHRAVIRLLQKAGIHPETLQVEKVIHSTERELKGCPTLAQGFPKGSETLKDKEKDKDQDQDQDQEKQGGMGGILRPPSPAKDSCGICAGTGTLEAVPPGTKFEESFRCSCPRGERAGSPSWPRWSDEVNKIYQPRFRVAENPNSTGEIP